jgi:hypothetical protein
VAVGGGFARGRPYDDFRLVGLKAACLAGAAKALRQQSGMQISDLEAAILGQFLAPARLAVSSQAWEAETAAGRALSQQDALTLLLASTPAPPPR